MSLRFLIQERELWRWVTHVKFARLRAVEALALKKAKQLEEYKAREAAAKAEADRIRNGQ